MNHPVLKKNLREDDTDAVVDDPTILEEPLRVGIESTPTQIDGITKNFTIKNSENLLFLLEHSVSHKIDNVADRKVL